MKEIIQIHIGQGGIQLGDQVQQLYCLEHGIQPDGQKSIEPHEGYWDDPITQFYSVHGVGKHVPRTIFVDLEPDAIDEIRVGTYRQLYHPEQLISGKDGSGNLYARGYQTVGQELIQRIMDRVRKLADHCIGLQGFILYMGVGGGTGSGLGSLILEKLSQDYGKKSKMCFGIYPSSCPYQVQTTFKNISVEPYNTVLSTSQILEYSDINFMFDNEAVYDMCQDKLGVSIPNYSAMNQMLAQVVTSITSSIRFQGAVNETLDQIQLNNIPIPRFSYLCSSYSPFLDPEKVFKFTEQCTVDDITQEVFEPSSCMVKCDPGQGKYAACSLMYRGDVIPIKKINQSVRQLQQKKTLEFANWVQPDIKLGANYQLPKVIPGMNLAMPVRDVCGIFNNFSIQEAFSRFTNQYDTMIAQRAFLHWYTWEGLEEINFMEARENLQQLEKEYEEAGINNIEDITDNNDE